MIDNQKKTIALIEKMKAHLPIPMVPTIELYNMINEKGVEIPKTHRFQIEKIHYFGDEGGICCGISVPAESNAAFVTSLTHLRIKPGHPLFKEIKKYQTRRVNKLARQHK